MIIKLKGKITNGRISIKGSVLRRTVIIRHQSGDLYAYDAGSPDGPRAFGPLHHADVPISSTAALDLLRNQPAGDAEDDGHWLRDELQAGRAFPVGHKRR
jgi:hypothetical protein